jgi:hypothetical protein
VRKLADIREQIKVILKGVPNIGAVHDRTRLAVDWNTFINRFKDPESGRINGIMFYRERMVKRSISLGLGVPKERGHIFLFRAIMGMKDEDETGILFDEHLTDIEEAFEDNYTLNGTCMTTTPGWGPMEGKSEMQIDLIDERMFGNVLCHYAEMRLCAIERHAT